MHKRREEIIFWLNEREKNYEVQKLKYKDLHLWPILRWVLFKEIVKNEDYRKEKKTPTTLGGKFRASFNNFSQLISGGWNYLKMNLGIIEKADVLFSGSHTHRILDGQQSINRYYDPLSGILLEQGRSFINADYSVKKKRKYTYRKRHYNITAVFFFYKRFFSDPNKIVDELKKNEELDFIFRDFKMRFGIQFKSNSFYNKIVAIFIWAKVFGLLVKASRVTLCFALCYYNEAMFGLNLAANRKKISSVDMQHGPQGKLHAAYTGFHKVPPGGFSCMPKYFWVWDNSTFYSLQKRLKNTPFHNVVLGGNPWITFLSRQKTAAKYISDKKIILFTFQPILPFIPKVVLEAMKNTPVGFQWWLRIHPRMTSNDISEIKRIVEDNELSHLVNIDEATKMALPLLLKRSMVHISKSSGCVLEAAIMGTPNIITDSLGGAYFADIIDNQVNFLRTEGDLWSLIQKIQEQKRSTVEIDPEPVLEQLLNISK